MTTTPVMTITDEQIAKIEKLSKRATPGDWVYVEHIDCDYLEGPRCEFIGTADNIHDGYYMASVNPSAILSIISRLRTAEKDAERYRWLRDVAIDADGVYPMVSLTDDCGDQVSNWLFGTAVDNAIDAAMEQSK